MGGGPTSPGELRSLLTPTLFTLIVHARLPYYKKDKVDFATFGRNIFIEDHFGPIVEDHVWPALIALSKIGLDHMPDLSVYLPAPTDPSYPTQCLGLQLLLDHCPRLLFRGVDQRWTYDYFSKVSQRLAAVWLALPDASRPETWTRWQAAGAGLDYWLCVRFWFATPFVHSELLENQEIGLLYTEETRSAIERASGQTDPNRAKRDQILNDVHGFPREYVRGPPQGKHVTRETWTWWVSMLMDIHKPIIDRFGRYPYLNSMEGRESTAEEIEWIDETGHFGEARKEVAERIREDVIAGRWTPLGTDSLSEKTPSAVREI